MKILLVGSGGRRVKRAGDMGMRDCGVCLRPSEFDACLRLHARTERVFHLFHLGDKIGDLDQFLLGVTAGDDHVLVCRLVLQHVQHFKKLPLFI